METSFARIIFFLIAGIALIVLLTAKFRIPAFLSLLATCFFTGIGLGMPMQKLTTQGENQHFDHLALVFLYFLT